MIDEKNVQLQIFKSCHLIAFGYVAVIVTSTVAVKYPIITQSQQFSQQRNNNNKVVTSEVLALVNSCLKTIYEIS